MARVDLGQPVELAEALRGLHARQAEKVRRLQENLERRAADQELRDEMARHGFTGRQYQRFENELARYGVSVLRGWMHSGHIFRLTAARGFALQPTEAELDELHRDSEVRQEIANMTVGFAVPRFRERALLEGGWRYEGGASLATYFMGACLYVFPNQFRAHRVYGQKTSRRLPYASVVLGDHGDDPAARCLGEIRVRDDLTRLAPRTGAAVALMLDDYSQAEIAEVLQTSERAVEGVIHRWRKKEQRRIREGGG